MSTDAASHVPSVSIDIAGGHKYIVAMVFDDADHRKTVIRANERCKFHADLLANLRAEIQPHGLRATCLGGGHIRVNPTEKTIRLFGTSTAFGPEPDRAVTTELLQSSFPEWSVVNG